MSKQTNKTFRVLDLMSENSKKLENLLPDQVGDVSIEVIGGIINDPYEFDNNEKKQIKEITSSDKIDYVVVGNNMSEGIRRAYAVDKKMIDRTCIVWIYYKPGIHRVYSLVGFETFMSRHELRDYITEYIKRNPGA